MCGPNKRSQQEATTRGAHATQAIAGGVARPPPACLHRRQRSRRAQQEEERDPSAGATSTSNNRRSQAVAGGDAGGRSRLATARSSAPLPSVQATATSVASDRNKRPQASRKQANRQASQEEASLLLIARFLWAASALASGCSRRLRSLGSATPCDCWTRPQPRIG